MADRAESPVHVQPLVGGAPRQDPGRWFRPATRAELWTGLALITLALGGSAWVLQGRADARALEQDPVRVEGKVVRLWVTRENNGPHYRVEYEYAIPPAGAQVVRDETQLVKGHYDMLREGGPIAVAVCRTDPANHLVIGGRPPALATAETQRVSLGFLGLLGLCGATSVWAWWVSGRKPGPAGVLAPGTVTGRPGGGQSSPHTPCADPPGTPSGLTDLAECKSRPHTECAVYYGPLDGPGVRSERDG